MASPGVPISHAPEVSAEQVADYLRRNPDFLAGHAELLDRLTPPSRATGDGVVDLQRFMIERLRGRHADLLQSGRRNLSQQSQINDAVIALIGATGLEHFIEIVATDLPNALDLDVAALCVEGGGGAPVVLGVTCLTPGGVDALLGPGRDLLIVAGDGDARIFGAGAGLVASAALIRLGLGAAAPPALVALGSRHAERFPTGQGGEALVFLGRVLARCLNRWLDLPNS
jgi:uncharacterized protein YigA (DUF484 family)